MADVALEQQLEGSPRPGIHPRSARLDQCRSQYDSGPRRTGRESATACNTPVGSFTRPRRQQVML
jgi:hypothetical protein